LGVFGRLHFYFPFTSNEQSENSISSNGLRPNGTSSPYKRHLSLPVQDHMDIFHEILKKKRKEFSPQSVLYIQNLRRIKLITRETPNLQILFDHGYGDIGHWICTYFDGNINHIYDSLNRNSLSAQQEQYLKCLYPFPFKNVFPQVQQQTNQYDCGIYAIAFATTICFNKNPANQIYHIPDMRTHAEQIFLTKTLMEFPSIPKD